jgi:hypothetical protein
MPISFLYHALATGVSGKITVPFDHLIEVQAPSAIPFTGGYAASRVECFRFKEILSFRAAETVVAGTESPDAYNTLVTATVEGLNILDMFTADLVMARVASRYPKKDGEQSFTITGSHFENLRIAGCPLEVAVDGGLLKSLLSGPPATGAAAPPPPGRIIRPAKTEVRSLAKVGNLSACSGLVLLDDGGILVPQFGTVYLAELLLSPCYQSITMFRAELDGTVMARVGGAHASTNGEPMPGAHSTK